MSKNLFFNGITDLLILSILDNHDSYMYEIVKSIREHSGGLLDISQNTIYTVAYKLEGEGKISEYSRLVGKKRTRVYYHLEPSGKKYLSELLNAYQSTTAGIHKVLQVLQAEEKLPEFEEVGSSNEQNMQEIYVGDKDVVSDEEKAGTNLPKEPCFGC